MRQYLSDQMPDKNGQLTISGKDFKYLCTVLRLQEGEEIWVRFPNQNLVKMQVNKIQAKHMILKISQNQNVENSVESGVNAVEIKNDKIEYWVFQFLPKSSKMDLIIRQSVECGVSRILPVLGEFSVQTQYARQERFERLVKEARQQSGSAIDTKIENVLTLEQALSVWNEQESQSKIAFVLHEADIADKSIYQYVGNFLKNNPEKLKKVALAIGPEGGMSEDEVSLLKENGFNLIHFKTNVLRCETACLYGIATIQNVITEYNEWHVKE